MNYIDIFLTRHSKIARRQARFVKLDPQSEGEFPIIIYDPVPVHSVLPLGLEHLNFLSTCNGYRLGGSRLCMYGFTQNNIIGRFPDLPVSIENEVSIFKETHEDLYLDGWIPAGFVSSKVSDKILQRRSGELGVLINGGVRLLAFSLDFFVAKSLNFVEENLWRGRGVGDGFSLADIID